MTKPTIPSPDPYPSRRDPQPRLHPRVDPVCHHAGPMKPPLTGELVASFERDGFIAIPALFSASEVESILAAIKKMADDPVFAEREELILEPESRELRSIFAPHLLCPLVAHLAADVRLLNVVHYLLGDEVYIHQARINLKPGFRGKEFYWHSDFETWHVEDGMPRMRAISASIALTPNTPVNGPLMLIPGSHRDFLSCVGETPENHYKDSLRKQEYGVPDDANLAGMAKASGIQAPTGPAGTVVFFDCNVMHGSNSNISPYPRSNAFFVYNAVSNRLVAPYSGRRPRPEFIAARETVAPLTPTAFSAQA